MHIFPLPAPGHEETVAEAPGTRRPLAELNRRCLKARRQETSLRSQPATLTASDGCIPSPSDAMSLFCLRRSSVAICIYVQRARARSREHIFVHPAHFVSKIEAVTFSTRLLSASAEPKKGRSQIKEFQSGGNGCLTLRACRRRAGPEPEQPSVGAVEKGVTAWAQTGHANPCDPSILLSAVS